MGELGYQWRFSEVCLVDIVYLISLNAYDLSINVFQPECVVSDTDPLNLLRVICSLPMVRVVGNGIGEVMICTSHEI